MMKNYIKAFTLIETLIAISILMASIASPMAISQKSLISGVIAKDQFTATYLAQEALEIVKARINYNIVEGLIWTDGIVSSPINPNYYSAILTSSDADISDSIFLDSCPNTYYFGGTAPTEDCYLTYKDNEFGYVSSGEVTPYVRNIKIDQINSNEIRATVKVIQLTEGKIKSEYYLTRNFFNY